MKTKLLLVSLAGALFATAACAGEPPPAPATVTVMPPSSAAVSGPASLAAPDTKTVAWLDGVCGAVYGYLKTSNDYATEQRSGTEVTRASLKEELGIRAGFAGKAVDELIALPPSPIPDGDAVRKSLVDRFTAARDAAAAGKQRLEKSGNQAAMDAAIQAMNATQKPLSESLDLLPTLKLETPGLAAAAAAAKKCVPA
ncbi:hypothetical protein [Amycolatopsis regifaucium]|uniref:Uncharacterized protein n=1 Tax=Amycolatopsis regifaucium TaxID=546365 RepID=A0A154MHF9_9PSEU|nr:hypothetical protein [Amycolatopsis regifaucium]KZB83924.1 hypothetical protein AVL48_35740 [Amycolatopsis regifaucium]OKA06634.1 hypothetical protein ATP06_0218865 [Amycolatopsis regifaucium]SFH22320.1 hypothetical protein SAMN04489731_10361 [Amycolatopsis regifaucium]